MFTYVGPLISIQIHARVIQIEEAERKPYNCWGLNPDVITTL
jgi:hypothetical protein